MPADFQTITTIRRNEQAVQGIPIGRLNSLEQRIAKLESVLIPTGTVDGSNTVFVFSSPPSVIVVDQQRTMVATSKDGNANWTGTTTVTLQVAPNFDIFGF